MAYNPALKIYLANGTLDTRFWAGGICQDYIDANFVLSRRGGPHGGEIVLGGNLREDLQLEENAMVLALTDADDADTAFWRGRVQQERDRFLEKDEHAYELRGVWQELAALKITAAVKLGTSEGSEADTGTVAEIMAWLFTNYISPSGICSGSAIAACATAVGEIALEVGASLDEVLETVELLASGAQSGVWVSWINAADTEFRFGPISTASADVQADVEQEGLAEAEELVLARAEGVLVLVGGIVRSGASAGALAKRRVTNPAPATVTTKERMLSFTGLTRSADMDYVGAGFFNSYRRPGSLQVRDVALVQTDLDEAVIVPNPCLGQAAYGSVPVGILQQEYLAQVDVSLGAALEVRAALGEASDTPLSRAERESDAGGPNLFDRFPEATYEDAPDGDDPPVWQTGENTGTAIATLYPHGHYDFDDGGQLAALYGGR